MAKKKGKNGKPKGKGGAKSALRHIQPKRASARSRFYDDFSEQTSDAAVTPRFSLRDEAKWMAKHRTTAFDSTKKLRHLPIAFVSAGLMEGTLKEAQPPAPAKSPLSSPIPLDARDLAKLTIRSPSPTPSVVSSSSEEVVVFKGRRSQAAPVPSHEQPAMSSTGLSTAPTGEPSTSTQPTTIQDSKQSDLDSETNSVNDDAFKKRRGDRPVWQPKESTEWVSRSKPGIGWLPPSARPNMKAFVHGKVNPHSSANPSSDALDDYAQNLWESGEYPGAAATFANRPLDLHGGGFSEGERDNDLSQDPDEGDAEIKDVKGLDDWTADQLLDMEVLSTSSDMEEQVARVLHKRERKSGLQYLVVYEGSVVDDARWLPATFLSSPADRVLVQEFEDKIRDWSSQPTSSTDDDSGFDGVGDEEDDEDDYDEDEDEEMDDETLARVLQKQEELGLGSDELLLHAADDYFNPGNRNAGNRPEFGRPRDKRKYKYGGGASRAEPNFPSASAMADALTMDPYGGFDIMDTERPSLRPLKRGRRSQFPPELEDTEFTEQFRSQWNADRAKKRLKKAERQELREQGLLGRKGKAPDLSVKYKEGPNFYEVTEEIRAFMGCDLQTLSLPPMDKHRRAIVHDFVGSLGVSSKSRGDGAKRFTVLSKSRRTIKVNNEMFDNLLDRKRFKIRWGATTRGQDTPKQKGSKGGPSRSNAGYKDGDIVGASAPELGPENRGRALLEKMGWSKGMALGSAENKGILQPIAQVVKTSRAGL